MIRVQREAFSIDAVVRTLKAPTIGAVVTFLGIVRGTSKSGDPVERIEWDAYESMAVRTLEEIAARAKTDFGVADISIVHRVGVQHVGDDIVLIAVASRNRQAAFDACQFVMHEIKRLTPLWKKEILTNAAAKWIG